MPGNQAAAFETQELLLVMRLNTRIVSWNLLAAVAVWSVVGCGGGGSTSTKSTGGSSSEKVGVLTGKIVIDGSSTVYPITQAVAEEFMEKYPKVKVTVGRKGTGGGFKKFVEGETDINDSSRSIDAKEIAHCKDKGIEWVELKVAVDGLTVVVNPANDWCPCLTIAQLKKIWEPGSKVKKWSDVEPGWPSNEIRLYGADSDSGTFDYFTEAVNGKAKACRTDYTPSADDNVLAVGVKNDKYALGYFGFSYYVENKEIPKDSRTGDMRPGLKAVAIVPPVSKDKPVATTPAKGASCGVIPTKETIESGEYTPMSRPLFLHVNKKSLQRPEVAAFIKFYLNEGQARVPNVGYISLPTKALDESRQAFEKAAPPATK